ncbi:hypothetical protein N9L45_00750, partial [Planctomycetota bacterium]|nr:hypothetical protein [Planctomycetota bacterium]
MTDPVEREEKQRSCFGCLGAVLLFGILDSAMGSWEESAVGRGLAVGLLVIGFWIGYRLGYVILGGLILLALVRYVMEGPT